MPSHQAVGFPVLLVSYWVLGLPLGALWAFKAPRNGLRGLWWGMTLGVWLHFSAFVAICFGHAAASRAPRSRCRVPGAVDWPALLRRQVAVPVVPNDSATPVDLSDLAFDTVVASEDCLLEEGAPSPLSTHAGLSAAAAAAHFLPL